MSLNCKPGIVINAISIRKTMTHLVLQAFLFTTAVGTNCFNALLFLQKKFFKYLDKAKNFSSLEFSICLIQIFLMPNKTLTLEFVSNANEDFWCIYCITDTTASDKPQNLICACAFANFAE